MTTFHERIHNAILDPNLQAAAGRQRRAPRSNGRARRLCLPAGLAGTARKSACRPRGGHRAPAQWLPRPVHPERARPTASSSTVRRDAAEAVQIILEIAAGRAQEPGERRHPRPSLPNPSPWSREEIELNHALEAAGIRVVETDLGEYIVQLRGEKPGHIITPAVHLRRGDVGRALPRKAGHPLHRRYPHPDRHRPQASCAKSSSRPISALAGVNFGVAETGTLCTRHQRGQRPHGHHPAAGPHRADGHGAPGPRLWTTWR